MFVKLTALQDVLLERVSNENRKLHKKISDPRQLSALLRDKLYNSVTNDNILKIDTSSREPAQAATLIVDHFQLT